MVATPINRTHLSKIAERLGFGLTKPELTAFSDDIDALMAQFFQPLDQMSDYVPTVNYDRGSFYHPKQEENPLNAWYVKTSIKGSETGLLHGRNIVVKDNIAVAGLPMMNGASTLEGYIPEFDATVISRILDAGGTIVGKAHCEYLCVSGGSNTNSTGVVRNPHDPSRTTGGSSSGCAALVGSGEIDLALGGDQGGSIRAPSSFCGVYGMKPTHGLVPYSGIFPIDQSLDYVGPMTRNTRDNAVMLNVIAGFDGLDPRQTNVQVHDYVTALDQGIEGLKIGFLEEGFGWPGAQADVEKATRALTPLLEKAGATVSTVSVPMHKDALSIWVGIVLEGFADMMRGNGMGAQWRGFYPVSLSEAHNGWQHQTSAMPDSVRLLLLAGNYLTETYGGSYYGKAQNLSRLLREQYDAALADVDVLIMPTTPMKAPKLPPEINATPEELNTPGLSSIVNTAAFDCTGHPAMNVPIGLSEGLPIGAMIVSRHFNEATIYRVAQQIETSFDWTKQVPDRDIYTEQTT